MKLNGAQFERIVDALSDGFDVDSLERVIRYRLGKRLDHLVSPRLSMTRTSFEIVRLAEMEGWLDDLLLAAWSSNPSNDKLGAAIAAVGLTSIDRSDCDLEVLARRSEFINTGEFLGQLARFESWVCRVSCPGPSGTILGTGCLVGSDLVLTSYHVVEHVLGGFSSLSRVKFTFDFRANAGGIKSNGVSYGLAEDFLVSSSRYSDLDRDDSLRSTAKDVLDYAVLRLAQPAGDHPIGHSAEPGAVLRGSASSSLLARSVSTNDIILVLQHPGGGSQKISLGKVIDCAEDGTRIVHDANTLAGSSGSPCLTAGLKIFGIHQGGAGGSSKLRSTLYNQAVPLVEILGHMQRGGVEPFWL